MHRQATGHIDNARARKAGPARGGFTLVELLVAITIVLIFGAMAAKTLSDAAGMWRAGYRRSYAYDTSTVIFQQIQDDLSAAKSQFWGSEADAYDQRVKFWVDFDSYPGGGRQWVRFVRAIPDYSVNPRIRNAGTVAGATGYYNLKPPVVATDNDLRPLEGMCEVAYMMGLDGVGPNPDSATLYRAVLAPIGDTTGAPATNPGYSFFGPSDAFATDTLIHDKALPLAQGVIYFEIRLWTQYTYYTSRKDEWKPDVTGYDPNGSVPFAPWNNNYTPRDCGTVLKWDSTCMDTAAPAFVMDEPQQGVLTSSGDAIRDNVFPRSVMAVVTIEPPAELALANPLRLRTDIGATDTALSLVGVAPPMNTDWPFLKIDDEWVRITSIDATNTAQVDVGGRGVRGTTAVGHTAGTHVLVGYTFTRVFSNPAAREYWGQ